MSVVGCTTAFARPPGRRGAALAVFPDVGTLDVSIEIARGKLVPAWGSENASDSPDAVSVGSPTRGAAC